MDTELKDRGGEALAARTTYDALKRIAPRSELEGMLATQMIAKHKAAMDCLRRAMPEKQTFAGRNQNLQYATKLPCIYERQLAALNKQPGKGQQKITVEHVIVRARDQAFIGNVGVVASSGTVNARPQLEHFAEVSPSPTRAPVASSRTKEPRR